MVFVMQPDGCPETVDVLGHPMEAKAWQGQPLVPRVLGANGTEQTPSRNGTLVSGKGSEPVIGKHIDRLGSDLPVGIESSEDALVAGDFVDGKEINVKSRGKRDGGSVEMTLGGELLSFRVCADLSGQRTSVKVAGWDVGAKSALEYEAMDAAITAELNGDSSGASILRSAFGERKECIAHRAPLSRQEAQPAAEAYFRMSARRFVAASGVAQGNAKLRVGNHLKVKGVGPLFEGKYYLSEVRHCFDNAEGFRTEFTAERAGIGKGE